MTALRWLVWRRRAYGVADGWVGESGFRWAWRANRVTQGHQWSVADAERAIEQNRVGVSFEQARDRMAEVEDEF